MSNLMFHFFLITIVICTLPSNTDSRIFVEHTEATHLQIISNQFNSNNINIDFTQYNKVDDNILRTATKTMKYKLQQHYHGIPIFGATLVVEQDPISNYRKNPIFGKYYNKIAISQYIDNVIPKITKETAIQLVVNQLGITITDIIYNTANLYVYYVHYKFFLVWMMYIGYDNDIFAVINADNGEIIQLEHFQLNAMSDKQNICADGGNSNIGKYTYCNDHPPLQIDKIPYLSNEYFIMINGTQNNENIFECQLSKYKNEDVCYITDNINDAYCVACDAYYHLTITFEIYLEWMDMLPFSVERLPIYVYLHDNVTHNARYTYKGNNSIMFFSDGDKYNTFPWVSLDIIAHEIAHGFTDKGAQFLKYGESLGLEEAYSDLVGECTEYYLYGNNDWKFGADIMKKSASDIALREYDNPSIGNYKLDGLNERDLSAIYMKAFYLLNTKYNWSMEELFKIMSYADLYYWTSDSTLNEGLCGIYEVIYDLYGDKTDEFMDRMTQQLFDAFNEVGIQCVILLIDANDLMEIKRDIEYSVSGDIGEMKYYYFQMNDFEFAVDERWDIIITLTDNNGEGDADLYVRYDEYKCKSVHIGNDEECKIYKILNDGIYYVMIYGFDKFEDVTLKWRIEIDNDIELTEIEFNKEINVLSSMELNEFKYFYVVLNEFDYSIGSYLSLCDLSSKAVGYLKYEEIPLIDMNENEYYLQSYDIIDTKPGIYYIAIKTNNIDENEGFMIKLENKKVFEIHLNEIMAIASSDWNYKYLYYNLSSIENVQQLKINYLNDGVVDANDGAINIYNHDGVLLCSLNSESNQCLLNAQNVYVGIYYIKYYGFVEGEITINIVNKLKWNIAPNSYLLPIKNTQTDIIYASVNDIIYLFDDKYVYLFNLCDDTDTKWNKHTIINPKQYNTNDNTFTIALDNRYIYIFVKFTEIYKFDTLNNEFVDNDIIITDKQYEYSCIAYDDTNKDIYFVGKEDRPLLIYNYNVKQWMLGATNNDFNNALKCTTVLINKNSMLITFDANEIWSYSKQYNFWYLLPQKLTIVNVESIIKNAMNNLLYLFDDYNHVQILQILDINIIQYYNETNLNIMNPQKDEILLCEYSIKNNEFVVWTKDSIQTTKKINVTNMEENRKKNNKNSFGFLYDFSSMLFLGISYILIALILMSCQHKAILQRKQLKSLKNKSLIEIESESEEIESETEEIEIDSIEIESDEHL